MTIEGNIVNIDSIKRGRIEIGDDGLIVSVSEEKGQADLVLKDELIFPGFIDLHVHARECANHAWDYKEDFTTAGQAAINGGVVAYCDMPNNPVPPLDAESYAVKYELTKKSPVEIVLYAGVTPTSNPLQQKVPYKVYMTKSTGDLFFESKEQLEETIKRYQGQNISFHCEDPKVLEDNKNQDTHSLRRPPVAEILAIEFALELIEKYKLKGRICHCSTVEGVRRIIEAKKRGLSVTAEITPHHLYFDEQSLNFEQQKKFQINPPVRNSLEDRIKLIEFLKNGDLDCMATDHSPHSLEDKERGSSGMPHLDTYGAFATWLVEEHDFTPQDILRVCSYNPSLFFNQFSNCKYGKIEPGFTGSLTVIDMSLPTKIEKNMLKTKAGWSPFEGVEFPGRVTHTIIKGVDYSHN